MRNLRIMFFTGAFLTMLTSCAGIRSGFHQPVLLVGDHLEFHAVGGTDKPAAMTAAVGSSTLISMPFVWGAVGDSYGSGEGAPTYEKTNPTDGNDFDGLSWGNDDSIEVPNPTPKLAVIDSNGNVTDGPSAANNVSQDGIASTGTANAARSSADKLNDDRFTCHRSASSGPSRAHYRLMNRYGDTTNGNYGSPGFVPGVAFRMASVACTGAKLKHLIDTKWAGSLGDRRKESYSTGIAGPGRFLQVVQPPQIDRMAYWKALNGNQLDALYIHVGGNDIDDRSAARMLQDSNDRSTIEKNGGFDDEITGIRVESTDQRVLNLLNEPAFDTPRSHKSFSQLNDKINESNLNKIGATATVNPDFRVYVSKGPNILSDANGGNCGTTDYTTANGADVGLPANFDDFIKNNLVGNEPNVLNNDAPEGLGLVVDLITTPLGAITPITLFGRHNIVGLGWKPVAAPDFVGHGPCTGNATRYVNLNSDAIKKQGYDLEAGAAWFLGFNLSFGILHPNKTGHDLYGFNIADAIRQDGVLSAKVLAGLLPPLAGSGTSPASGIQIGSMTNQSVTIVWHDRATSENGFDILVSSVDRQGDQAPTLTPPTGCTAYTLDPEQTAYYCSVTGVYKSEYTWVLPSTAYQNVGWKFAVRACNSGLSNLGDRDQQCGAWSPFAKALVKPVSGVNGTLLSTPTGVSKTTSIIAGYYCSRLDWPVNEYAHSYTVRSRVGSTIVDNVNGVLGTGVTSQYYQFCNPTQNQAIYPTMDIAQRTRQGNVSLFSPWF